MTITRSVIKACGSYLPEKILTNQDLEKMVDTSDEWIFQRSGIRERRIAADNEFTSDMAIKAAKQAMEKGGYVGDDIDGIIVATTTPDETFPSVAVKVQTALGTKRGATFDVQAVCSGFVYALSVADSFIKTGIAKRMLVIGAEKMSSVVDWSDRRTCVLFADGAGAVIIEADENSQGTINDCGIISSHLHANGKHRDILKTSGGVSSSGKSGVIEMEGKEVFKYAVKYLSEVVQEVLEYNNIESSQIDWLVPHQANIRIIEGTAKKLNMPMDKVIVTVQKHGNTSAASIPLALAEGVNSGKIKKGDLVLIEALGGGLTWGANLIRI